MRRPHPRSQVFPDGSWLEPEELAYTSYAGGPSGSRRRAYARSADGVYRVFKVGIPDTFFSIPAIGKIRGRYVSGYVSVNRETEGLTFTIPRNQ